jgi:orotidine-5'-phosphate decarboxylase
MTNGTKIIGITVLTSVTDNELKELGYKQTVKQRVLALSHIAKQAGAAGVVCSANEVQDVKKECGDDFIVITPGIRPSWAAIPGDDQRRIATPGEAISRGADYIVVGRPILNAENKTMAARLIVQEIQKALDSRSR